MSPTGMTSDLFAEITSNAVTTRILREIRNERARQDQKWGEQNHPMIGGHLPDSVRRSYADDAARWKRTNDLRSEDGSLGFDGILLEEVFEALEEADPVLQRAELVQVAAVAAAMIAAIDRREAR